MKQKIGTVVGFIVIALIVIAIVVFTNFVLKEQDDIANIQIPVPSAIQKEINQNKTDLGTTTDTNQPSVDTTDWQTYKSSKYGFEFQYPSNFVNNLKVSGENNVCIISLEEKNMLDKNPGVDIPGCDISFSYYADFSALAKAYGIEEKIASLEEYQKSYATYFQDGKFITFAGYRALEGNEAGYSSNYTILIEKDSHIYGISFPGVSKASLNSISKQILSTFKFTK